MPAVAPPSLPTGRRAGRAQIAFAVILVLLLGSSVFGVFTARGLESARADLDATVFRLESTRVDLTAARAELDTTKLQLGQEKTIRAGFEAQTTQLQTRVKAQDSCIQAMNDNVRELQTIDALMTDNYNRTAVGSVWAQANAARSSALSSAIDAYYQAFSNAYDGFRTTANTWIATGNRYIQTATSQVGIMNSEVAKGNQALVSIDSAFASFNQHLAQTKATCGIG